jgi:hypothetical protein
MIATSSPALITSSVDVASLGMSTYSRLIVSRQLSNTLDLIPEYFSSRVSNSLATGNGAGKVSVSLDVYELADAKYKIVKWPSGRFVLADMMVWVTASQSFISQRDM